MGLRLTGKGSILDAIGGGLNTAANAVVAGAKDVGDLGSLGLANLTGNQQAAQNASNAISTNDQNIVGGNLGQNLGGLSQDVGLSSAIKAGIALPVGAGLDISGNSNNPGIFGNSTLGGLEDWASNNNKTDITSPRAVASNAVLTGVNLATLGKGAALEKAAAGLAPGVERTAEGLTGNALAKAGANAFGGAVTSGVYGAGQGISNAIGTAHTPKQALEDIVKPAAQNFALGALGGTVASVPGLAHAAAEHAIPLTETGGAKAGDILPSKAFNGKSPSNINPDTGKNFNEGAFSSEDKANLEKQLDEGADQPKPSELSPKEQMAMFEPKTPLNDAEVNTARNPIKADIPEAHPGDYEQARINPQIATAPVEYAGGQWIKAMRELTPDEKTNFWRSVENPKGNYSPELQEAISRWREVDDRIHSNSQALGGNTNYLNDHALHPWNLPEGFGDHVINGGDPAKFPGISSISRKYRTIAEGEKAGLTLNSDPIHEGVNYIGASSTLLRRRALFKGLAEADRGEEAKKYSLDLGGGNSVALSENGMREAKGYERLSPPNKAGQVYRNALVRPTKQTLLSVSQFHPINISLFKAGPALALRGHPVLAARGVFDTFRSEFGKGYSDRLQAQALHDGTVDFGARVGSPMKFGSDFANEGKLRIGHSGLGERTIFEKAMPSMQYRMLQGLRADLDKRGISADTIEAHQAGTRINEIMGFVNQEVRNLSKGTQRRLTNFLLAPQFTRSKWATIKSALKDTRLSNEDKTHGNLAGSYARAAVVGNTAMDFALALGVGAIMKQKSDDIRDLLIRSIFQPSIPSNQKDNNQNTTGYKLPASYTSEALGLIFNITRGQDGHLQVQFKPQDLASNLENYGRNRLNVPVSTALKIATNTDYAGKPLYDPSAPLGTKVEQAATTATTGLLPIGLQGIVQTKAVKNLFPQNVQDVINANSPGTNPLAKSVASSLGFTPVTDKTVGKGLQTTQYFDALGEAKQGLNRQERDALDAYSGSKKNPVTGKYDVMPNVNDQRAKATSLLQNPKVIDNLIAMNQKLASEGQTVDPLWQQPKSKIEAYLQYQAMPPGGPDQVNWRQDNTWYDQGDNSLYQQRQAFFNSLPLGDPNKPAQPIEYPTPSSTVAQAQTEYFSLYKMDPAQAEQFLLAHPEVQDQMDKQAAYTNQLRQAQGYAALRTYPKPNAHVQAILDAMPQGSDSASRKARALAYQDPEVAAWSQESAIYNLTRGAGLAQLQGNSLTSKDLKSAYDLQYDTVKNPDGTYSLKYADPQGGMGANPVQPGATALSGSSGYSGYSAASKAASELRAVKTSGRLIKADMKRDKISLRGHPKPLHGFGLKGPTKTPRYVTINNQKTSKPKSKSVRVISSNVG